MKKHFEGLFTQIDKKSKLLWAEIDTNKERATSINQKLAKQPYVKTLDSFDFEFQPSATSLR